MPGTLPITIAIPTYRREQVLVDTVTALLALQPAAAEVLVLDQTEQHEEATERALSTYAGCGRIRWLRLAKPSIPAAMNAALGAATQPVVLFLDDDILPEPGLVAAHASARDANPGVMVAGRVLQPWDDGEDHPIGNRFGFASAQPRWIREFMGGNFSLARADALAAGGFDENFVKVAYRFEAEFAHRWLASGRRIFFEPRACIHHLKADAGGTRTFGEHLTTWRPDHAVGAYYWGLRTGSWKEFLLRPARAVATRYHLRHPWRIPFTFLAELGGMLWALRLHLGGPRLISPPDP